MIRRALAAFRQNISAFYTDRFLQASLIVILCLALALSLLTEVDALSIVGLIFTGSFTAVLEAIHFRKNDLS